MKNKKMAAPKKVSQNNPNQQTPSTNWPPTMASSVAGTTLANYMESQKCGRMMMPEEEILRKECAVMLNPEDKEEEEIEAE